MYVLHSEVLATQQDVRERERRLQQRLVHGPSVTPPLPHRCTKVYEER